MRSLARLIIPTAAVVLAAWPAAAQPPAVVRIGALNIEWLGRPSSRAGDAKGVAQDPKDIAGYVKDSGVAVLALEEICDDDGVSETRTNTTLNAAFAHLNASGQSKWKYRLFAKHPAAQDANLQLVGLAWNESVMTPVKPAGAAAEEYRLKLEVPAGVTVGAPGKPAFERWATAMKFSAGPANTDVVVIPVHLKSNRPAFQGQDSAKQREVESQMLLAALADVRAKFTDDDVIVLGDTNVLTKGEKAVATFTAAGFVDLNAGDAVTYSSGQYQNPFDRAFVPQAAGNPKAKEFAATAFDVFRHLTLTAAEYRKLISDHRMIRITVEVMDDDD